MDKKLGDGIREYSCSDCAVYNCRNHNTQYPPFCLTTNKVLDGETKEMDAIYGGDTQEGKMAISSAQIEGRYYCEKTRVEETVLFIKAIGAKKVGIATCIGLINEAKTFTKILQKNGISYVTVVCKVGGEDKREMGLAEEDKIRKGGAHETMCNPILQARVLNREKTDLNIAIGLCVGHDALFSRYSEAPVTTLIVKDCVLGHNPAAALYSKYYNRLYQ